jgi:hypothetical protein
MELKHVIPSVTQFVQAKHPFKLIVFKNKDFPDTFVTEHDTVRYTLNLYS